jgi:hypothetical protein
MTRLWVKMPREFEASVAVLWPRPENEQVAWPPAPSLTDATLEGFIGRFIEDRQT